MDGGSGELPRPAVEGACAGDPPASAAAAAGADATASDHPLSMAEAVAAPLPGLPGKAAQARTLEQMMSLKPGDDARTEISKKVSWILRHGAKKVNLNADDEGWVDLQELSVTDILAKIGEQRLMEVIDESNRQKVRYEFKEVDGKRYIRAVSKSRRQQAGRDRREQRRALRQGDGPGEGGDAPLGGGSGGDDGPGGPDGAEGRRGRRADGERPPWHRGPDPGGGGGAAAAAAAAGPPLAGLFGGAGVGGSGSCGGSWPPGGEEEGPTFEQQLAQGWKPVYQGERVVAMLKDNVTIRPGRRETAPAFLGKGGFKGGGGFGGYGGYGGGGGFEAGGYGGGCGGGCEAGRRSNDAFKGDSDGRRGKGRFPGEGKGTFEGGRYVEYGYGGGGKDEGRFGKGDRYGGSGPRQQQRWRCVAQEDAIVRSGFAVEADVVGSLPPGAVVAQVGPDKVLSNGIVRMRVQSLDLAIDGWVTRSAESVGGPVFFRPAGGGGRADWYAGDRGKGGGGGGGGGKGTFGSESKGRGRRPIGEAGGL